MLRPALAYPATVLIRDNPLAVAENTSISRVWAVTGILSPVSAPFNRVPIDRTPESAGVRLINVPATGEKTLFGVVDWYICAFTVTVEPIKERAAVVLKNALKEVMIPARGTWNAKLDSVPLALVISIVDPNSVSPGALLPKPTKAGRPASPPAIVVKEMGSPDANGMMAPEPATPVAPVEPVAPVAPVVPVGPVAPVAPVAPVGPVAPSAPVPPVAPVGPVAPSAPVAPIGPSSPGQPWGPWMPMGPVSPWMPWGPVTPWGPMEPVGPVGPVGPGMPLGPWGPTSPCGPAGP